MKGIVDDSDRTILPVEILAPSLYDNSPGDRDRSSVYIPVFAKVQSIRCPSTSCSEVNAILNFACLSRVG